MGNYSMWEIYRAKIIAEGYKLEGVLAKFAFRSNFYLCPKRGPKEASQVVHMRMFLIRGVFAAVRRSLAHKEAQSRPKRHLWTFQPHIG